MNGNRLFGIDGVREGVGRDEVYLVVLLRRRSLKQGTRLLRHGLAAEGLPSEIGLAGGTRGSELTGWGTRQGMGLDATLRVLAPKQPNSNFTHSQARRRASLTR